MMNKLVDRFLRYVKQHTSSDPRSEAFPSTNIQLGFAAKLARELEETGLTQVEVDKNGYVTATLPANVRGVHPVVGFIAHMDTSPDFNGKDVNPIFVDNYDGGLITLNGGKGIFLSPEEFPELKKCIGLDLIATDGMSLLGADDKAGIAEIVTAMETLINFPEIKHGEIKVAFTPDEEIGRGVDYFDVEKFGADFAYTVDGGGLGELEYENFNAARAVVKIKGKSVHPGMAKNKMINALIVANRLISILPPWQRPEHTEGYEGFFHLTSMEGNASSAEMEFIIRDHDQEKFERKKEFMREAVALLNKEYGEETLLLEISDQYCNMRRMIEPAMYVVDIAREAMEKAGIVPDIKAIRGGTDGARLSFMGLPCPNIFAGGINFHGPYEFVPVQYMEKAVEVILNICKLTSEISKQE